MAALLLGVSVVACGAQGREVLFLNVDAYDPVPSPDGKLIAFVLTGRKLVGGTGGFGRSNLRSEIAFSGQDGTSLKNTMVEGFLGEWLEDGSSLSSYRDWKFNLVGPDGKGDTGSIPDRAGPSSPGRAERAAYVPSLKTFAWIEQSDEVTLLQTPHGPIARRKAIAYQDALIVPSPDGRYLAVGGPSSFQQEDHDLWVFDTEKLTWTDLGAFTIHPDPDWDYIKPSWNPWFPDSRQLAFFTGDELSVVSPDGRARRTLLSAPHAGLAVPSRDGLSIAYVTFTPRPRRHRPDLLFWGGSTIWVVACGGGSPVQVTGPNESETFDLRWLSKQSLIFDRIGDEMFNAGARIWTVPVLRH